jgi:beta-galactosidase
MKLGVCYYPEQWPESLWATMPSVCAKWGCRESGSANSPGAGSSRSRGRFDWVWLDRAIATLHEAGLEVILGTPTATPPKWLVDAKPDILAWDEQGRPRGSGRDAIIAFPAPPFAKRRRGSALKSLGRYGEHPAVVAWQTDNEYGCHDTILSYSPWAAAAFRPGWKRATRPWLR